MTQHLLDTDQIYGQDVWPGRLAKRNAWLLVEIPFKWMVLPGLLFAFPLFIGMAVALLIDTPLAHALFLAYWAVLWVLAFAVIRNYRTVNYYDKRAQTFHEDIYLFNKRLRARSWPRSDFSGVSCGRHWTSGSGPFLAVRLHGHHLGQMLLAYLGADTREEMIDLATTLARVADLPLLPEQSTGSQHQLDDMRQEKRWANVACAP
jgi:hypothetical protein